MDNNKSNTPPSGSRKSVMAAEACPEIWDWWDSEKNEGADPTKIPAGSNRKFYFRCPKCGNEIYRAMVVFLSKQKDGTYTVPVCQKCTPSVSKLRVPLVDAVPEIEKYWDYERNEGKKPSDYGKAASDKVWTFCPVCGTSVRRNVRYTWEADEDGVGHVLHCRTCGKRRDDNSLMVLFPDIKKYWVYDKNEHKPEYYTISSGKRVFLRCPDCGKERQLAIGDAVVQDATGKYYLTSCADCKVRKILFTRRQKDTNIAKRCPDVIRYWDPKNTYRPDELTTHSLIKIYTHCPSCGATLYRRAINSFGEENGVWHVLKCQKCAAAEAGVRKALSKTGPLIDECPEVEEWWDFERNSIELSKVTRGSHYEAYFKCPACHKGFRKDVHAHVTRHRDGRLLPAACSACGYSSKGDPEDNLLKVCSDIAKWWNYEKNAPFRPEQFTKGSQFMAYMTCPDCGLELYTGIHSLVRTDETGAVVIRHDGRCRKYRAMASENNLLRSYPQVANWWDYEKNSPDRPEEYTLFAQKRAYFKCPECGTETYRRISDAFFTGDDDVPTLFKCPYCSGTKPIRGVNSLAALYPEIAAQCISTDDTERISPSAVSRMEWECPDCGGIWFDLVVNRVNGQGCPYCAGKRALAGVNTLDAVNPELAAEWSSNNECKIGDFLPSSRYHALWICPKCNGEYTARIFDREVGDDACPYCENKKVLPGYNSFEVRHSELVQNEWAKIENMLLRVDPDKILDSYSGRVWWKCPSCDKKYMMSVADRLMKQKRGHNPCPFCNGRRWKKTYFV